MSIFEGKNKCTSIIALSVASATGFLLAYSIIKNNNSRNKKNKKKDTIKKWLESWVYTGSYPNLSLIVFKGNDNTNDVNEVFYHDIGYSDVDTKQIVDRKTIYRIYSMTKPIVNVAAMILIDRGLLSLDDHVSKWIPSFSNMKVLVKGSTLENQVTELMNNEITIKQLMTHTSGICYGLFMSSVCDHILAKNAKGDNAFFFRNTTLPALCEIVADTPLAFQPGSQYLYGLNTDILGYIVELITETSLDLVLKKELFEPLLMVDTGFVCPSDQLHRLASCYDKTTSGYKKSTSVERERNNIPANYSGGGGLVSTIDDYAKFAKFLLLKGYSDDGVKILSEKWIDCMSSNHLPNDENLLNFSFEGGFSESVGGGIGFGLNCSVITDPMVANGASLSGKGEFGWGGVASTFFYIDPIKNSFAVLMTQLIPSSVFPIRQQMRYLTHWLVNDDE
jgi:CubicO group peptidase (beta-lactamase class C family)